LNRLVGGYEQGSGGSIRFDCWVLGLWECDRHRLPTTDMHQPRACAHKSPSRVRFRQIGHRSHDAKLGDPQRSAGRARADVTRLAGKIGVEMRAEIAGVVAGAVDQGGLSAPQELHSHEI
jgi:hypothetical protein